MVKHIILKYLQRTLYIYTTYITISDVLQSSTHIGRERKRDT